MDGTPQAYTYKAYDANGNQTMVSMPTLNATRDMVLRRQARATGTPGRSCPTPRRASAAHFDYTAEGAQASRIPELAGSGTLDYSKAEYWTYFPDGLLHGTVISAGNARCKYDADGNQTSVTNDEGSRTPRKPRSVSDVRRFR